MTAEINTVCSEIEQLRKTIKDANEKLDRNEREHTNRLQDTIQGLALEFTCTICQEIFIKATTLPCAHSFCEFCLRGWLKGHTANGRKSCPICRRRIQTKAFHSVVLDNAIEKMMETIGDEQKERRLELKQNREEQEREEASRGWTDTESIVYRVEDDDAHESRDDDTHQSHTGNNRRRRRLSRQRRSSSQSSRFRYNFLRPPFFITNNIVNTTIRPNDPPVPANSRFTFNLGQSAEVPVIDLTASNPVASAQESETNNDEITSISNINLEILEQNDFGDSTRTISTNNNSVEILDRNDVGDSIGSIFSTVNDN